ncbi:MAG: LysE family translocator [Sodalis sp. (in: enterobacteria)]|uniref:LysE family translocator n=1 Tax=Sodalis sp. (in: enterobacteria) TaxID=1898979 RepID=UPI0039E28DE2
MSYTTWCAFLMVACLTAISPGPGSIQAMSHGLSQGWRKTSLTIAGQETALALIMIAIGTGAGIILTSPNALMAIRVLGAAWLIYTGYSTWRAPIPTEALCTSSSTTAPLTKLKRFITGFMTTATNARIIVFMISLMPQFIEPTQSLCPQLVLMTLTMLTVDAVMMHVYAFSASRIQHLVREPRMIRIQNRLFGGALVLSGVSLLLPF